MRGRRLGDFQIDPYDLVGKRFGMLTVEEYTGVRRVIIKTGKEMGKINTTHHYNCRCDCGNLKRNVRRGDLLSGNSQSCGCSRKDNPIDIPRIEV